MIFGYVDQNNRATNGSPWNEWAYPRLQTIANGWGGTTTYTYTNDGRPYTSWYNWRVTTLDVSDGVNANPMKTTFAYGTPCYDDAVNGWCFTSSWGQLVGHVETTATSWDY